MIYVLKTEQLIKFIKSSSRFDTMHAKKRSFNNFGKNLAPRFWSSGSANELLLTFKVKNKKISNLTRFTQTGNTKRSHNTRQKSTSKNRRALRSRPLWLKFCLWLDRNRPAVQPWRLNLWTRIPKQFWNLKIKTVNHRLTNLTSNHKHKHTWFPNDWVLTLHNEGCGLKSLVGRLFADTYFTAWGPRERL